MMLNTPDVVPPWARLISVGAVAAAVIGLEIVSAQAISFVADYLLAMQVLAVALLGVAVGGLLAYIEERPVSQTAVLVLFPLAVMASFPIIARLNPQPGLMMALMTLPYALAGVFISWTFARLPAGRVYLYDLSGAALGAVIAVIAVPGLREEGSFFLLGALASVPLILLSLVQRDTFRLALGALPMITAVGLLIAHVSADPFNMMNVALSDKEKYPRKVFSPQLDTERYKLIYSRGSLVERIDILKKRGKKQWVSVYNGRIVDLITNGPAQLGKLDNRIPNRMRLGEDPSTLLIGPSGQGLTKGVQAMGGSHVDAVEINAAIAGLMSGPLYKRSGRAYEGFNLIVGDVRTFLATTDRQYDYITALNTHRIWSMGHLGPPEFVHTLEGMRDYLDHLTDRGVVLFEERTINEQAVYGVLRVLLTLKASLVERGLNPNDHFAVWEVYHRCKADRFPDRCRQSERFTFIMAKKTPFNEAELAHLRQWEQDMIERQKGREYFNGIVWRHLPDAPTDDLWSRAIVEDDPYAITGADPEAINLSIVTDDQPFPFDTHRDRAPIWSVIRLVAGLAVIMGLLPTLAAFFAPGERQEDRAGGLTAILIAVFSLLGMGYLLVEVVLIQKLSILLASPTMAMAVILATLLGGSGLGGLISERLTANQQIFGALGAAALAVLGYLVADPIINALFVLPLFVRILATVVLILPLAFCMGLPFPAGMALTKRRLSARHAGLMFGVNGAVAATAAPIALLLNMSGGFGLTLMIGAGIYVVVAGLLALVARSSQGIAELHTNA